MMKEHKDFMTTAIYAMALTLIVIAMAIGMGFAELATDDVTLPNPIAAFRTSFEDGQLAVSLVNTTIKLNLSPVVALHDLRMDYYSYLTPRWLKNREAAFLMGRTLYDNFEQWQKEQDFIENSKR